MNGLKRVGRARIPRILGGLFVIGGAVVLMLLPIASVAGEAVATTPPHCSVGSEPWQPAYDPVSHEVYIPNFDSSSVTVLKGTCTVAATVKLPSGSFPSSAAFDPINNDVYVTDMALNQVYVISGTKMITTITDPSFDGPRGIVFDPLGPALCVTNYNGDTVSFIGPSNTVAFALPVGDGPLGIGFDPYYGTINVVNLDSDNVTVFDGFTLAHLGDVTVGGGPTQVAFDIVDDLDYVTNSLTNSVSVIADTSVVGTINGFHEPVGIAWSQAKLELYVPDEATGKVSVVSGLSIVKTISAAKGAYFDTYDDFNDKVYVTDLTTNSIYVLS
jgi:YVTN family beta-propeller protein